MCKSLLMLIFCILAIAHVQAFTINYFAPTAYNSNATLMNANLGLGGSYTVEDFEDGTIVAGLGITYSYQNIFPHAFSTDVNVSWDGTRSLNVVGGNYSGTNGGTTFTFTNKASSVGLGFGGMDCNDWALYVNGILLTSDVTNGLARSSGSRIVYVRVDAGIGEQIQTVYFQRPSGGDYIYVDHVAFQSVAAVPEPGVFCLLLLGIMIYPIRRAFNKT